MLSMQIWHLAPHKRLIGPSSLLEVAIVCNTIAIRERFWRVCVAVAQQVLVSACRLCGDQPPRPSLAACARTNLVGRLRRSCRRYDCEAAWRPALSQRATGLEREDMLRVIFMLMTVAPFRFASSYSARGEGADLSVGQPVGRSTGTFALRIVMHNEHPQSCRNAIRSAAITACHVGANRRRCLRVVAAGTAEFR